jgi:ABC-type phosphate/phosphonate transport system substrate-binding protein
MSRLRGKRFAAVGLLVALALGIPALTARAEENLDGRAVQVGLVRSLMRDTPEAMVPAVLHTFKALITSQTGLEGRLSVAGPPEELGRDLIDGKFQLGVFHGFEFAWARQACPKLKPLVLAINHDERLHAYLVVGKDFAATCLADLRGKTFALPRHSREHCHLYLERECLKGGEPFSRFFAKVSTPSNVEEALDLVATGRVAGTVVDSCFLQWYREQKPGRFAELKKIEESEAFPAAVIAYNPDTLDAATLDRLREGFLSASKNARGLKILGFCQITRFEVPPADFNGLLADIARSYPPIAETKGR